MRALAILFLLIGLSVEAAPRRTRRVGPVSTAKEAKSIAEQETSGHAVNARKIRLNGASCGWEVEIHMPREDRGWRCVVDGDTHAVFTKTRIPNPAASKHRR